MKTFFLYFVLYITNIEKGEWEDIICNKRKRKDGNGKEYGKVTKIRMLLAEQIVNGSLGRTEEN